jgi:hypothetical protein
LQRSGIAHSDTGIVNTGDRVRLYDPQLAAIAREVWQAPAAVEIRFIRQCARHRFAYLAVDFAHQRDGRAGHACSFSAQVRAGDRDVKITLNADGYANSGILRFKCCEIV